MGTETPSLSGVFRFVARLHTLSRRGMRMALAGQPKCRYGMLQSLYNLIEQHGCDGAIYVSDIARQMAPAYAGDFPRAASDGAGRPHRPRDRPKGPPQDAGAHHPAGERARNANERQDDYFARIMARLTPEQLAQANAVKDALLAAIEAENAAMKTDLKGEPPHDENF